MIHIRVGTIEEIIFQRQLIKLDLSDSLIDHDDLGVNMSSDDVSYPSKSNNNDNELSSKIYSN